ncbi:zonular occludens toxin domain-containing protein [Comamonas terrigena]|uniref:zonular occludens toxin domain-containing protein n=1 Tax=Comamonas terrigena TaxID=32013 RepID=UPI002446F317|nr:zonular occludens toxin domain-containing protein [Comamonas terrigena]MDH0047829.1 Zonular occludens toxin [Comamonas terrigena]MDH0510571.1 Zonular occludens toxin [Comamonas terrigena]MDH1090173.1 Zonular occludens toxin [Comamonas terrigena]MDH1503368.1 Zonular occludens toxin [Comamonas terrigena]
MPINTYTGLMGSGKSYECVSSVIVPAVKAGRRVVTNVDGIDSDAIRAYCQDKFSVPMEQLGEVVHCTNDDVPKASFLPHGQDVDTFCKPGDIICIDEAWRFWGTDCKLLPEHKVFFREHRHFVHPDTKVCCDLVLMVQDITDLHRTLRVVVEVTFRTTKIKTLGWQKTYRVEMWEGYKLTVKGRVSVENKRYDVEIFPLYSSYTGGTGKELQVDSRQNVLRNPKLWLLAVGVVLLFSWGVHTILGFFNGTRAKAEASDPARPAAAPSQAGPAGSLKTNSAQVESPSVSTSWRLVGTVQTKDKQFIVVESQDGRIRLEHPSAFMNTGAVMVGDVDGQRVTAWSGARPATGGRP